MTISTLSGLGDAVYAYPIVKEFSIRGPVNLYTRYREVFADLPNITYIEKPAGIRLAYSRAKNENFYESMCKAVGANIDLVGSAHRGVWAELHPAIMGGKELCIIKEPCTADMHKKTRDFSMSARPKAMQDFIDANKDRYYFMSIDGGEVYRERLSGIDAHLKGLTVQEYLAWCAMASAFVTQIGHLVPIAQWLGRRLYLFEPENNTAHNTRHVTVDSVIVKGFTDYEVYS